MRLSQKRIRANTNTEIPFDHECFCVCMGVRMYERANVLDDMTCIWISISISICSVHISCVCNNGEITQYNGAFADISMAQSKRSAHKIEILTFDNLKKKTWKKAIGWKSHGLYQWAWPFSELNNHFFVGRGKKSKMCAFFSQNRKPVTFAGKNLWTH